MASAISPGSTASPRARVLERLTDLGLWRTESHKLGGTCDRCDTIVEPYLSLQWFVRMKPLAELAISGAAQTGQILPAALTTSHALDDPHPRLVHLALFPVGHRIPVWYCQAPGCEEILVDTTPPTRCSKCGGAEPQDEDARHLVLSCCAVLDPGLARADE
jgi:valyl-tRNA synthetase